MGTIPKPTEIRFPKRKLVEVTNVAMMNFSEVRKATNGIGHEHQIVTAMLPNKIFDLKLLENKLVR